MGNNSVNTNVGAMVALQNLNATQNDLAMTENRINTGMKVASAKDNGAIWAIAQNQRAASGSLNAVKDSLQRSASTVDVAIAGGTAVSDLLLQMKQKALAASDSSLDQASRDALNQDFMSLRDQINKSVSNATFNGVNMISGTSTGGPGTTIAALANDTGTSKITVQAQDLALGGTALGTLTTTSTIGTQTNAAAMISTIGTAIQNVSTALSNLGTGSKALTQHLSFVGKLQDSIDAGVGNLVDADLAKESAHLTALQTKQQLGIQALSIANQSSQGVLSLFR
jgi:flagellin